MRVLAPLLVMLPALAGCLGGDSDPASTTPTTSRLLGYGGLEGLVTDDELRPVAGVNVSVEGAADAERAQTDAMGRFAVGSLLEGAYFVRYEHERYEAFQQVVLVEPRQVARADAALSLRPDYRPYHTILAPQRGHYTCAMEALILTGDCLILWQFLLNESDPVTTEKFHLFFNVSRGWSTVVVELAYVNGSNNQLEGIHLYLAPANESRDPTAHHTKMAVAEGPQNPLRLDLRAGERHATAERYPGSTVYAELEAEGAEAMALVYPRGKLASQLGTVCPEPDKPDRCFLGVGVGLGLEFTLYVAIFYNGEPVPETFTMLPP